MCTVSAANCKSVSCSLVFFCKCTIYQSQICRVSCPASFGISVLGWYFSRFPIFCILSCILYFVPRCVLYYWYILQCAFVPRWVLSVVATLEIQPPARRHQQPLFYRTLAVLPVRSWLHITTSKISSAWERIHFTSRLFSAPLGTWR